MSLLPLPVQTFGLLALFNVFMTRYGHLKNVHDGRGGPRSS